MIKKNKLRRVGLPSATFFRTKKSNGAHPSPFSMKKGEGFTLMEITVVIAIIVVLSGISIPIYRQLNPNIILNAITRDITSDLRYAQQLAVTEQVNYQIVFDQIANNYKVINSETEEIIKTVNLDARVEINSINNLTDYTVNFNVTGAATESGEITLIGQSNITTTIEIKPSGYVKIAN